ncbi:FAD-dependent oxidoreductase [Spirochaeta cellobiosiphila]|uniref:FAD-dependent oxidoreductase n=1 Tax=Spirochaeta cellobiosiphila TaxID=504483 RepID=UPI0003F99455|nr:FAD-dependent oxidoreductase [Spirochaeta cellobiosiphila]
MKRYDLIIVGAGPAGLSAAIEAAKAGLEVVVFDENQRPGGQLFKQIHKFFGSKEHKAKIRGYKIGEDLLQEAQDLGVKVLLNSVVTGLFQDREVTVKTEDEIRHYKGDTIIIATGASENMVYFEGWTLPGVIGAGAAQTMMNLHNLRPGKKIIMLGSGNVGLVVSYQLLQAGCEVIAVVDAAPRIGGYGVHASKLTRSGVPFYLSHTIIKAEGEDSVNSVTIGEVGPDWKIMEGSEKTFEVDTVCLAVGLSPMSQILDMAGCTMVDGPGGKVPLIDEFGSTSLPGVFVAGDVSGIEEASAAMIEGRIAGTAAAEYLGYIDNNNKEERIKQFESALTSLRQGMFAPGTKGKFIPDTEEGIPVSENLLRYGYLLEEELHRFPGVTKGAGGVHPVIECTQNIPCNPCQDACNKQCITIGHQITSLPVVDDKNPCVACGMCVAACSGQAIFLIDEDYQEGYASIALPYEFSPVPQVGQVGKALDRQGQEVCEATVVKVKSLKAYDHTHVLTMKVPKEMAMSARFFRP